MKKIVSIIFAAVALASLYVPMQAMAKESVSGTAQYEVTVGSVEATQLLSDLRDKYPSLKGEIEKLRKSMASMDYGDRLEIELQVYNGEATAINWNEVVVGAGVGLGLAIAWNAFGGELLCFIGFVPMCACVGPQC